MHHLGNENGERKQQTHTKTANVVKKMILTWGVNVVHVKLVPLQALMNDVLLHIETWFKDALAMFHAMIFFPSDSKIYV